MKPETKKRIHYIYSIVLSAMLVVCGFLLIAACLQIYLSGGEQTYTPEKVAAAFGRIAVPVYICIGMIVLSILLQLILRQQEKAHKGKQTGMQLKRLQLTRDAKQADADKQTALRRLIGKRRGMQAGCSAIWLVCAAVFGFFALVNYSFYPEPAQATAYVVSLMPVFAPCCAVALAASVLFAYLICGNSEKQIALYKQFPPLVEKPDRKNIAVYIVRYGILALSIAVIVYGLVTGGWQDVLTKAVNICTECVGLG